MHDAYQGWFIGELYHDTLEVTDSYHMHQTINQNAQKDVDVNRMDKLYLTGRNKTNQSCNKNSSYGWVNWLRAYHTNQRPGFTSWGQGYVYCWDLVPMSRAMPTSRAMVNEIPNTKESNILQNWPFWFVWKAFSSLDICFQFLKNSESGFE